MERKKHILFIFLLVILFAPLIQQKTEVIPVNPLVGGDDPKAYLPFTFSSWKSGEFQDRFDLGYEERIGFRPALIRMKNQFQYSLFRKANATGVVVGKDRYLFEEDYIRAYTGRDYLGEMFWKEKFRRFQAVHDTLQSLGIQLALILEPGKGSYYNEKIPDRYFSPSDSVTNYQEIKKVVSNSSIPFLDLNSWFVQTKKVAEYPHFTRGGIHWAYSSMLLASDTILRFANGLTSRDVPEIQITKGQVSRVPRDTDNDLTEIMNLAVQPKTAKMHYPEFSFSALADSVKPKVLIISDSFYFNILNAGIPDHAFANNAFWYYSKAIYPDTWTEPRDTSMINIREETESMDLIFIMVTERFYHRLAWNFIEGLYKSYYPDEIKNYVYDYETKILTDYQWFNLVVADAENRRIPLSSAIEDHAKYQLWKDEQDGLIPKDVSYYVMKILKDPEWTKKIREKAIEKGLSFDEQLKLDATWMVEND